MKDIKEIKIGKRTCYMKEYPNGNIYLFKGFVCPFCGSKKTFLLKINEEYILCPRELYGHRVCFVCTDHLTMDENVSYECSRSVGMGFFGMGIPLADVVKICVEDYKGWKCNNAIYPNYKEKIDEENMYKGRDNRLKRFLERAKESNDIKELEDIKEEWLEYRLRFMRISGDGYLDFPLTVLDFIRKKFRKIDKNYIEENR